MVRSQNDRQVHVPASLLKRIRSHERIVKMPSGYQRSEGVARVIERALDLEDVARAGILAPHPQCWKHEGTFETFSSWEELIAHVRAEHSGIMKGNWKK